MLLQTFVCVLNISDRDLLSPFSKNRSTLYNQKVDCQHPAACLVTSHCLVGRVLPLCILISSSGGVGIAAVAVVTALSPPRCPTSQCGFDRQATQDKCTTATAAPKRNMQRRTATPKHIFFENKHSFTQK